MAATGMTPRRGGHCRAPGIKPLEIRDGGGKAPDFALSLAVYQYDFTVWSLLELRSHSATSRPWVWQGAIRPRHSLQGSSQSLWPSGTKGCFTLGNVSGTSPCAWRSFLLLSTILQKLAVSWLHRYIPQWSVHLRVAWVASCFLSG